MIKMSKGITDSDFHSIERQVGELPQIVVIGNQSAGKSSLIEAMSGVRILIFYLEIY